MLDAVLAALQWAGQFSDPLAWLVIATFLGGALVDHERRRWAAPGFAALLALGSVGSFVYDGGLGVVLAVAAVVVGAGTVLRYRDSEGARALSVLGWVLFAVFWATLIHHFGFVQKSLIEGIGAFVGVPGSLYAGYLLARGRDSLFVLSRAVAVMGLVFFPFETIVPLKTVLIETVTRQTEFLIGLVGYHAPADFSVVNGASLGHLDARNTFRFEDGTGPARTYTILIACTGVGSMAIFAGLVAAVRAPLDRKVRALAVSLPIIYALNLVRNVFIALGFGQMRLQVAPELVAGVFGFDLAQHPGLVSYYLADRVISQSLSVVALVVITYLVVRELPEVLGVIEDVLFMATGTEYDLQRVIGGIEPDPVRADGSGGDGER